MSKLLFSIAVPFTAAGFAAAFVLVPHTVGLEKAKQFLHLYKDGMPVPVPPRVHELFDTAKSDLLEAENIKSSGLPLKNLKGITPFSVFGFDMYRMGWLLTNFGALVGVPEYFATCDKKEGKVNGIRVANHPIDWESPEGKRLKESLMISDEAKKFAIAREILHHCKDDVTENAFINGWNAWFGSLVYISFHYKLHEKQMSRMMKLLFNSMIFIFSATLWASMRDMNMIRNEKDVDAALCDIDVSYAVGGTEYYYSILKRNMALRVLLGGTGEKKFTALGNENVLIRQKHAPIVDRAEFCRTRLQKYIDEKTPAPS